MFALIFFGVRGRSPQRLLAIALITVALYPCVSATDDLFTFSLLASHDNEHGFGAPFPEDSQNLQTVRMLSAIENVQVAAIFHLAITFLLLALVWITASQCAGTHLLCRAGRAPPFAL